MCRKWELMKGLSQKSSDKSVLATKPENRFSGLVNGKYLLKGLIIFWWNFITMHNSLESEKSISIERLKEQNA